LKNPGWHVNAEGRQGSPWGHRAVGCEFNAEKAYNKSTALSLLNHTQTPLQQKPTNRRKKEILPVTHKKAETKKFSGKIQTVFLPVPIHLGNLKICGVFEDARSKNSALWKTIQSESSSSEWKTNVLPERRMGPKQPNPAFAKIKEYLSLPQKGLEHWTKGNVLQGYLGSHGWGWQKEGLKRPSNFKRRGHWTLYLKIRASAR